MIYIYIYMLHRCKRTLNEKCVGYSLGGYNRCDRFGRRACTHLSGASVWGAKDWGATVWEATVGATESRHVQALTCRLLQSGGLQSEGIQSVQPTWGAVQAVSCLGAI